MGLYEMLDSDSLRAQSQSEMDSSVVCSSRKEYACVSDFRGRKGDSVAGTSLASWSRRR